MAAVRTNNVVVRGPQVDVDSVEHSEQWEPPRDALNDGVVTFLGELINDSP